MNSQLAAVGTQTESELGKRIANGMAEMSMTDKEQVSQRKLPAWMNTSNVISTAPASSTLNSEAENNLLVTYENPTLTYTGKINYCQTIGDCGMACEDLMKAAEIQEELVLGFDMEWPVNFRNGSGKTAVIQICAEEHICHIFHVSSMRNLPVAFVHLLQHPKVKLVGLNIKNDLWKLNRDFDITVKSLIESRVIELREFANKVLHSGQSWSLDRLVLYVLKMNLEKSNAIRISDWGTSDLSKIQQTYAATDAYASLLLYNHLKTKAAETI